MKTKYVKIQLGKPNDDKEIFVREEDFIEMKNAMRSRNSKKILNATFNLLIGSPDGMTELLEWIEVSSCIHKLKNINILKIYRDMINHRIKTLKNENTRN